MYIARQRAVAGRTPNKFNLLSARSLYLPGAYGLTQLRTLRTRGCYATLWPRAREGLWSEKLFSVKEASKMPCATVHVRAAAMLQVVKPARLYISLASCARPDGTLHLSLLSPCITLCCGSRCAHRYTGLATFERGVRSCPNIQPRAHARVLLQLV